MPTKALAKSALLLEIARETDTGRNTAAREDNRRKTP
jgi:hypothetical protein